MSLTHCLVVGIARPSSLTLQPNLHQEAATPLVVVSIALAGLRRHISSGFEPGNQTPHTTPRPPADGAGWTEPPAQKWWKTSRLRGRLVTRPRSFHYCERVLVRQRRATRGDGAGCRVVVGRLTHCQAGGSCSSFLMRSSITSRDAPSSSETATSFDRDLV